MLWQKKAAEKWNRKWKWEAASSEASEMKLIQREACEGYSSVLLYASEREEAARLSYDHSCQRNLFY